MAKKKNQPETQVQPEFVESSLEDILADRFSRYSKYIIQERALPDARDGLKPVQRRILWAMFEDGNTFSHPYRKSAKTVGNVIGNYHPHGDSSVYDALVRLSQDWKLRIPLIDMQGNNGSIDDDPAAAMRYTEARLSKISNYLLEDIDKQTVEWAPNFSDEKMEPTTLPARFPNLLINGITGIAAGYATNIPPHNLTEVLDATIYRIEHPDCSLDALMEFVKGPDFPTGGIIMGREGIRQAMETGKGRILIRGKCEIEQTKTIQQIVITEIPYEVVKSSMVKKMDEIRLNKKVDGILDVRDESDRHGLRIVVDLKKESNAQAILNYLYKNTDLQISYNYNTVAIVNKAPVLMGLEMILDTFISYREQVVIRRSQYTLNLKEKRDHIVEGLIQAISVLDEVIALIRASQSKSDSKKRLMEAFGFTEAQAEAIVMLQLYRLSNTDILELKKEAALLAKEIRYLKGILKDPKKRNALMIQELQDLKNEFVLPRKSLIQDEIEEIVIDQKAMIANEQVMLTVSADGYVKKVSLRSYASSQNSFPGQKDGDRLLGYREVSTLDTLLFFTDKGKYGQVPVYKIEEARWKDVGSHISSYVKTEPQEKIVSAFLMQEAPKGLQFVLASRQGMIKRLAFEDLPAARASKTQTVMNLAEQDAVISCICAQKETDALILASSQGFGLRYEAGEIPRSQAKSKGVRGMNVADKDELAAMIPAQSEYGILLFNEGQLKKIACEEVPRLKRPAKGVHLLKKAKSHPVQILQALSVSPSQELTLQGSEALKLNVSDLNKMALSATYSTPFKEDRPLAIIGTLDVLPQGFWQEELPANRQPSLFEGE